MKRLIYCILASLIVTSVANSLSYNKKSNLTTLPILVEAIPALLKPWQETIKTVGRLSTNQSTTIKAETSGRVTAIYFQSGEHVKAGDPLIQLNSAILKAQLNAAKAETQLSKADYERGLTLYKKKVFAKADLDKVSANYQVN